MKSGSRGFQRSGDYSRSSGFIRSWGAPSQEASAQCEPSGEPEQVPEGPSLVKTATQTPVEVACKSPQRAWDGGKTAGPDKRVVSPGKRVVGATRASERDGCTAPWAVGHLPPVLPED